MYNVQDIIKYNSCIFIFGIDDWMDILQLSNSMCKENKIIIVEPDLFRYKKYYNDIIENIILIYFDENNISYLQQALINTVTIYNYKNIVIGNSINYDERYKESYDMFQSIIKDYCYKLNVAQNTLETFKEINLKNSIYYLNSLNNAVLLDEYKNLNKNVPAIIVSAGPSLDKNIGDMVKYRKKLKNFFIIAGNRTLGPLLKNDIIPDLLVTIDPGDIAEEMISNSNFYKVPIVYYEKSSWKIINGYKGPKIAASELFLQSVCGMKKVRHTIAAGSVAHTSTDVAAFLGCNPIIFIGQDFGYTFNKNFAECAKHSNSNTVNREQSLIYLTDVFDNKIESSGLFKVYKENMEIIINRFKKIYDMEFINCSYGAKINGAPYEELKKVLVSPITKTKKPLANVNNFKVDNKAILKQFHVYVEEFIRICDRYIEEINKHVLSFEEIEEINSLINSKISERYGVWIKDYYETFGIEYRQEYFNFTINEYNNFEKNIYDKNNIYFEIIRLLKNTLLCIQSLICNA